MCSSSCTHLSSLPQLSFGGICQLCSSVLGIQLLCTSEALSASGTLGQEDLGEEGHRIHRKLTRIPQAEGKHTRHQTVVKDCMAPGIPCLCCTFHGNCCSDFHLLPGLRVHWWQNISHGWKCSDKCARTPRTGNTWATTPEGEKLCLSLVNVYHFWLVIAVATDSTSTWKVRRIREHDCHFTSISHDSNAAWDLSSANAKALSRDWLCLPQSLMTAQQQHKRQHWLLATVAVSSPQGRTMESCLGEGGAKPVPHALGSCPTRLPNRPNKPNRLMGEQNKQRRCPHQ